MAKRPSPEVFTRITKDYFVQPSGPVPGSPWVYEDQTQYREYSGSTTPGYPRNLKNNEYHLLLRKSRTFGNWDCVRQNTQDTRYWDHEWSENSERQALARVTRPPTWPYPYNDVSHDMSVQNKAINGAIDAIRDQRANVAQIFAERKQTVGLVLSTVERLHKAMRAAKRGDVKGAANALGVYANPKRMSKEFGQMWLEFQYGWKPLLSDVKGSAESLARSMLQHPILIRGRKSAKVAQPGFTGVLNNSDTGDWKFVWGELEHFGKCELVFEVKNDFTRQGAMLGLTDPMGLAWELLPWSFVFDWFLPVGDFLSRLSYNDGLVFKTGYLSLLSRQEQAAGPVAGQQPWAGVGYKRQSGTMGQRVVLRSARLVYANPPLPVFPEFKDPFSIVHVTNALALWSSGFRKVR